MSCYLKAPLRKISHNIPQKTQVCMLRSRIIYAWKCPTARIYFLQVAEGGKILNRDASMESIQIATFGWWPRAPVEPAQRPETLTLKGTCFGLGFPGTAVPLHHSGLLDTWSKWHGSNPPTVAAVHCQEQLPLGWSTLGVGSLHAPKHSLVCSLDSHWRSASLAAIQPQSHQSYDYFRIRKNVICEIKTVRQSIKNRQYRTLFWK